MQTKRLTGSNAAVLKYDVLTAISLCGLHGTAHDAVSMMRLSAIVTARYNWARDEVSMGQQDMARIWGVTARTAKREIRRWLDRDIVICTRPGVRGRVAAYRLNLRKLYALSQRHWHSVGPDYAARMETGRTEQTAQVVRVDFGNNAAAPPLMSPEWRAASEHIRKRDPQVHASWIAPLEYIGDDGRTVTLRGPSAFASRYVETHYARNLADAVETCIGPMRRIVIRGPA